MKMKANALGLALAMVVAGAVCFLTGLAYYFFTTDLPDGNFKELRESGEIVKTETGKGSFWLAAKDYRVWALFFIYAACFGIELTINGMAAVYYADYFGLGVKTAGFYDSRDDRRVACRTNSAPRQVLVDFRRIDGKWYIYFAAGEAENIWNIRMFGARPRTISR